jgi:hypothetical protein
MDKVFFTLLGVIVATFLNHFTATKRDEKQRFDAAAMKFRSKVIYKLEAARSFEPGYKWQFHDFNTIASSIYGVTAAAAEFSYFIEKEKTEQFNEAVVTYCKFSKDVLTNHSERNNAEYQKKFNNIVEHLLDFAKEKPNNTLCRVPGLPQKIKKYLS